MYALFGFGGMAGAIVALIILIIKLIQKRPIRNMVFLLIAFIILVVVTLFITPIDNNNNELQKNTETKTDVNGIETTSELNQKKESEDIDSITYETETKAERVVAETISQVTPITETNVQTEKRVTFVLIDGEVGDYGTKVVLNRWTEFEETEIEYHIPSGNYNVTNNNAFGGAQVTVYCGGPEYDGEWEYFTADDNCSDPIVVMAGETKELVIKDGQFVVLSDGSSNIQFELVNK